MPYHPNLRSLLILHPQIVLFLNQHNQAKTHAKAQIVFSLLDVTIICEHVHCLVCRNCGLMWQRSNFAENPTYIVFLFLDMHSRN